jgi:hypothetical protein
LYLFRISQISDITKIRETGQDQVAASIQVSRNYQNSKKGLNQAVVSVQYQQNTSTKPITSKISAQNQLPVTLKIARNDRGDFHLSNSKPNKLKYPLF